MSTDLSPAALEEYRALRATIRERGTARLIVAAITFVSWAALALAVQAFFVLPVLALLPLVTLLAGFEVVFAAHVSVERIGRYVQAVYERADTPPRWEHAAMALSPAAGRGSGLDPIFTGLFLLATALNMVPVVLMTLGPLDRDGFPVELAVFGVVHAAMAARIVQARAFASSQRARDLAAFEQVLGRTSSRG